MLHPQEHGLCLLCSWGLVQGDLPHQSHGAGLRSPCPGGFVPVLQERMGAGDDKALSDYHSVRCCLIVFVVHKLGASRKQHGLVAPRLLHGEKGQQGASV